MTAYLFGALPGAFTVGKKGVNRSRFTTHFMFLSVLLSAIAPVSYTHLESYNCVAHNVSPIRVDIDSQPSTARDIKFRSVATFRKRPAVNHFAGRRKVSR